MEELPSLDLYVTHSDNIVFVVALEIVRANHRSFDGTCTLRNLIRFTIYVSRILKKNFWINLSLTCRSLSLKTQLNRILYYPILVRLFMDGYSDPANNFLKMSSINISILF